VKAILEFNLPEEKEDHETAIRGTDYKIALEDMDNYFRNRLKYEDLSEETRKTLQDARDHLSALTMDIIR
jgi:hypothetical protein